MTKSILVLVQDKLSYFFVNNDKFLNSVRCSISYNVDLCRSLLLFVLLNDAFKDYPLNVIIFARFFKIFKVKFGLKGCNHIVQMLI